MSQLSLGESGPLAALETFARTTNRAKSTGIITRAPWESDEWRRMSRVARFIRFTETYCVAPVARRLIELHPYQREMYERFLDPSTRQDMEKIPRGNAKTTTVGAFITTASFLEPDHDVPIVATTVKQAEKTTYGAVLSMVNHPGGQLAKGRPTGHPELSDRVQVFTSVADKRIVIPQTNSIVYPMADAAGPLQGLNPSIGVLDEASEAEFDTWGALTDAAGKRSESITIGISTPSFKIGGNAMLDFEEAFRAGIELPGIVMHEHKAPDGCDHRDEAMWYLANPALSTVPPILSIDALRAGVHKEQRFRCYRLAQWPTTLLEGWLGEDGAELWDELADPWDFVRRRRTFVGVDVSLRHDSTAVVSVQERDDGRLHAVARIWFPGAGAVVDQAEVREYLRELSVNYELAGVAYDPRFFESSAQDLAAEGLPMVEVPQTAARMVPAVAAGYRAIRGRLLSHDADPAFGQQVVNAQARPSEGGVTISKNPKAAKLKIDACVALCLALSLVETSEDDYTEDAWSVR